MSAQAEVPEPHDAMIGLREVDARRLDAPAELIRGEHRSVRCDEVLQRKVDAAGHVAAAKSRARLGLGAGESSR